VKWKRKKNTQASPPDEEIRKEVKNSFKDLTTFILSINPIKLLSQLALTYLSVPEGEYIKDGDDVHKWNRWIEFLSGLCFSKEYPYKCDNEVDGNTLTEVENLLIKYFDEISKYIMFSPPPKEIEHEQYSFYVSTKLYSLNVRGEAYPSLFKTLASEYYSIHDKWFQNNLGFTINDAIEIYESIMKHINEKINTSKNEVISIAAKKAYSLYEEKQIKKNEIEKTKVNIAGSLIFGNSDELLTFTLNELVTKLGKNKDICEKFLKRLSQPFGYRNSKYTNVFQDPFFSPWDYNTLYERPIVKHNTKYFIPVLALFPTVLFNTFFYDLIKDKTYQDKFNELRGKWLERKSVQLFSRIFPSNEIYLNPTYQSGNEFSDVLITHDMKIIIIQCKSKTMRFESKIGDNIDYLKEDLNKAVGVAFKQGINAKQYLLDNDEVTLFTDDGKKELTIDMKMTSDIYLINITLDNFQDIITRFVNIKPDLATLKEEILPWSVSLFNLEVVTDLIQSPSILFHYLTKRRHMDEVKFEIHADEIDLLEFYFHIGLNLTKLDNEKKISMLALTGYSGEIDKYIFEKYELNSNPKKPNLNIPEGFFDLLQSIENLTIEYKTDCICKLLDLNYNSKKLILQNMKITIKRTKDDLKSHNFSTMVENQYGITFISMDAKNNISNLYEFIFNFILCKKYSTRKKEWIGLGWDYSTNKFLDIAIYLSYEWFYEQDLEDASKIFKYKN